MLLKAPAGVTAVTLGGVEIAVEDGLVEVPEEAAATLYAHGFVRAESDAGQGRRAAIPDPSRMTRQEMIAWLKSRGVAVKRPIATPALRALMRERAAKGE